MLEITTDQHPPCECHSIFSKASPGKKAGMTTEKYLEMLDLMPLEGIQILKDQADAKRLVKGIYGSQGK